jgi:MFS transporter/putative zinc finger protein
MTVAVPGAQLTPRTLARRLRPLNIGMGLQGILLWVPVEKLFQTQIGFTPASIGAVAAAYAAVVPLLEVPSGILADRWSRNGILVLASIALAASSLLGGLSTNVVTYLIAAMILGVYFALNSGTVDSVVYDVVLEETGSSGLYEKWIGRVRMVEAAALTGSALVGGVLASATSPRVTYFVTVPFTLASIVAFLRFDEPRLHRAAEPTALRQQVSTTFRAMTRVPQVRRVMLLAAVAALMAQAVFEFGPLWLVSLQAPAAGFGPYWAALVATLGLAGYLTSKLHLERRLPVLLLAAVLVPPPIVLVFSNSIIAVVVAQTVLALLLAIIGIHAGLLLHDAVPSTIRAGVSSGVGTLSWLLFLPFSLGLGWLASAHGVHAAGWALVGLVIVLAGLLGISSSGARTLGEPSADRGESAAADQSTDDLAAVPIDLACREVVRLVTDYLDGVLPAGWRNAVDAHLTECDGCTAYLEQVRSVIDALERLDSGTATHSSGSAATKDRDNVRTGRRRDHDEVSRDPRPGQGR